MILGTTVAGLRHGFARSLAGFRDDERGSMTLIITFMFILMIMWGGIAVDVMRYETRRVTLQQTLDRAALAAASLQQTRSAASIVEDWFTKSGLENETLKFVDYSQAVVTSTTDAGLRRVQVRADVFSQNYFMSWYSPRDFFQTPLASEAAQGVSQIEVMLVLDITGSMNGTIGGGQTKIQALRNAASTFVDLVKGNDPFNEISIGMVPYAAQVNMPANLRAQFNTLNLSSWDGVANAGVPFLDCIEVPVSTFTQTGLSQTLPMRMGAVADANNGTTNTTGPLDAFNFPPIANSRNCNTVPDNAVTPWDERTNNHILMPTKDGDAVKARISRLTADGNTNIAMGMRWGTALIDETARPIYTAIAEPAMAGRPANNDSLQTRKIIILMTDGSNVTNTHIRDNYKSGPSPIWRGADGRMAMRFWSGGTDINDNTRPTCAGANEYFIPHLQPGAACDAAAWAASPSWPGSGTVVQLDWSEVWRYVRVSYVARQLYGRSNVSSLPSYNATMDLMRATYLTSVANLDSLLQQNCTAARAAGIEIYGIAFAAPAAGAAQINQCASLPKASYYYDAANNAALLAAFQQIATDISDLRLTQ
jgi:Flp pilus assembly protein TadG